MPTSYINMKALDNIIGGLKPKSEFEVQITRFCCILLVKIKEMNSASYDFKKENDVEPLNRNTEDYPESDIIFPKKPEDDQTDLSMNADIYGNGAKIEQALKTQNCAGFSCNEVEETLNEAEIKTEPYLVYEAHTSVAEFVDIPAVVEGYISDVSSVVEADLSSPSSKAGVPRNEGGVESKYDYKTAIPVVAEADPSYFAKPDDDQTDLLTNFDVYRDGNITEQAQFIGKEFLYDNCAAFSCNEVAETLSEVKTGSLMYTAQPSVLEFDDIPSGAAANFSDMPSVIEALSGNEVGVKPRCSTHNHTEERPQKCTVCGKWFTRKGDLADHLRKHNEERPHKCTVCGKGFKTKRALKHNHMRYHLNIGRPHKCTVCGKRFKWKALVTRHMMTHTEERIGIHKCSVCGKVFKVKSNLTTHCMRMHTGEKPYKCSVDGCGKRFIRKDGLSSHMLTHTGEGRERPHKCPVCGKAFAQKGTLLSHSFTHTGERPYKCTVCGIGCTQKSNLKLHMKRHATTAGEPHKCTVCGSGFKREGYLRIHMKRHDTTAGERLHKCTICGSGFTKEEHLTLHIQKNLHTVTTTATGELPYKCNVCGIGFRKEVYLTIHMKFKHTGELPYN